jgi:hypothetical protein
LQKKVKLHKLFLLSAPQNREMRPGLKTGPFAFAESRAARACKQQLSLHSKANFAMVNEAGTHFPLPRRGDMDISATDISRTGKAAYFSSERRDCRPRLTAKRRAHYNIGQCRALLHPLF